MSNKNKVNNVEVEVESVESVESTPTTSPVVGCSWLVVGVGVISTPTPVTLASVEGLYPGKVVTPHTPSRGVKTRNSNPLPMVNKSTVTNPVEYVWCRLPQLITQGLNRGECLRVLISEGVSTHTSITQYGKYTALCKNGVK